MNTNTQTIRNQHREDLLPVHSQSTRESKADKKEPSFTRTELAHIFTMGGISPNLHPGPQTLRASFSSHLHPLCSVPLPVQLWSAASVLTHSHHKSACPAYECLGPTDTPGRRQQPLDESSLQWESSLLCIWGQGHRLSPGYPLPGTQWAPAFPVYLCVCIMSSGP